MSHIDVDELHPAPVNVFRLWHIFMERVNPMVKVIHAPSMQPYLQEAANSGRNIPNNVVALIFSIYTVSVVALEDEECQTILGWTKKYAFHKFSTGVRAALHKLGFLVNYDLVTLQALVLYTVCLLNPQIFLFLHHVHHANTRSIDCTSGPLRQARLLGPMRHGLTISPQDGSPPRWRDHGLVTLRN